MMNNGGKSASISFDLRAEAQHQKCNAVTRAPIDVADHVIYAAAIIMTGEPGK
jgi:hypothetical protein